LKSFETQTITFRIADAGFVVKMNILAPFQILGSQNRSILPEIDLILSHILFSVERLTLFVAESADSLPYSLQVMPSLD